MNTDWVLEQCESLMPSYSLPALEAYQYSQAEGDSNWQLLVQKKIETTEMFLKIPFTLKQRLSRILSFR